MQFSVSVSVAKNKAHFLKNLELFNRELVDRAVSLHAPGVSAYLFLAACCCVLPALPQCTKQVQMTISDGLKLFRLRLSLQGSHTTEICLEYVMISCCCCCCCFSSLSRWLWLVVSGASCTFAVGLVKHLITVTQYLSVLLCIRTGTFVFKLFKLECFPNFNISHVMTI